MFLVLLKFTERRALAASFMPAHNDWIRQGFDDGVFVFVGSLQSKSGGALLALDASMEALQARVAADPLVAEGIVSAEILEISPSRVDDRLSLLREGRA